MLKEINRIIEQENNRLLDRFDEVKTLNISEETRELLQKTEKNYRSKKKLLYPTNKNLKSHKRSYPYLQMKLKL